MPCPCPPVLSGAFIPASGRRPAPRTLVQSRCFLCEPSLLPRSLGTWLSHRSHRNVCAGCVVLFPLDYESFFFLIFINRTLFSEQFDVHSRIKRDVKGFSPSTPMCARHAPVPAPAPGVYSFQLMNLSWSLPITWVPFTLGFMLGREQSLSWDMMCVYHWRLTQCIFTALTIPRAPLVHVWKWEQGLSVSSPLPCSVQACCVSSVDAHTREHTWDVRVPAQLTWEGAEDFALWGCCTA